MTALPNILAPGCVWLPVLDGNAQARAIFNRHYSRRLYRDGRKPKLFVGPGEKMVLLSVDGKALFVWRKFKDDSGQRGVNCAVFRNEGPLLSSELIRQACEWAWARWPNERLYTYVNPAAIESVNPGCCFKKAGWKTCGWTKGRLVILHKYRMEMAARIQESTAPAVAEAAREA